MTEEEVIEFEKNNKDNYIEPKEWSSVDDIIQGKQLILHGVSKPFYCDAEFIKSKKCKEQCSPCWYKSK